MSNSANTVTDRLRVFREQSRLDTLHLEAEIARVQRVINVIIERATHTRRH